MLSNSEIRAQSRALLGGKIFSTNWLMAVVLMLIYGLIMSVSSYTAVGGLILMGPMTYGVYKIFLDLKRGYQNSINIGNVFNGFKDDLGGTILLGIMISLFTVLWSFLFVIPGIVKSYAYSMAFFIKADNPDWDWKQCINASQQMMNGHKMELFLLDLSLFGWMIVGSLACGVGLLWVTSYMYMNRAGFYEELRKVSAVV